MTSSACDGSGSDDMFTATLDTSDGASDGEVAADLTLCDENFVFDSGTAYRVLDEESKRTYSLIVSTESGDRPLVVAIETPDVLTMSTLQSELDVRVTIAAGGGAPALAFSSFTDNPNNLGDDHTHDHGHRRGPLLGKGRGDADCRAGQRRTRGPRTRDDQRCHRYALAFVVLDSRGHYQAASAMA